MQACFLTLQALFIQALPLQVSLIQWCWRWGYGYSRASCLIISGARKWVAESSQWKLVNDIAEGCAMTCCFCLKYKSYIDNQEVLIRPESFANGSIENSRKKRLHPVSFVVPWFSFCTTVNSTFVFQAFTASHWYLWCFLPSCGFNWKYVKYVEHSSQTDLLGIRLSQWLGLTLYYAS